MKEEVLWSINRDVAMWFCSTEIVELSEIMSSGKWNCAWWISEEDLHMIKLAIFVVPLFVLILMATAKNSHNCRWSFVVNCNQTDTGSYVLSPPTFETQLHQSVRPHFFSYFSLFNLSLYMLIFFHAIF